MLFFFWGVHFGCPCRLWYSFFLRKKIHTFSAYACQHSKKQRKCCSAVGFCFHCHANQVFQGHWECSTQETITIVIDIMNHDLPCAGKSPHENALPRISRSQFKKFSKVIQRSHYNMYGDERGHNLVRPKLYCSRAQQFSSFSPCMC